MCVGARWVGIAMRFAIKVDGVNPRESGIIEPV